jgi:ubiquinone/menaquinone biosynthesis C-methylase UbiE
MTESGVALDSRRSLISPDALRRIGTLIHPARERLLEAMHLRPGDRCLDVGCGTGQDTLLASGMVGAAGRAIGIDLDPFMIADAERQRRETYPPCFAEYGIADAASLPFASSSFDAVCVNRVLQHVSDPLAVLREMVRVTRRGGRVTALDSDWATLTADLPDRSLERRVVTELHTLVTNPHVGRELPRLLRSVDIDAVLVEPHTVVWRDYQSFRHTSLAFPNLDARLTASGRVTHADVQMFHESLLDLDRRECFLASATLFLVAGIRT